MIRTLIFDFDGLILDTEVPAFQSWQEIFRQYECDLSLDTWAPIIGGSASDREALDPCQEMEIQLGHAVNRQEARQMYQQRYAEHMEQQTILPGVRSCIADAERLGLKLGVASSSSRDWVTGHLGRLGLADHFACVRCSDDVQRTKPDPELYLSVLDALIVGSHEAIALEDSPNGVLAARHAGIFCIAVPNALTSQLSLDQADQEVGSLEDLALDGLLLELHTNSHGSGL